MTSATHIDIDWSSPAQGFFAQLGDANTSQDDSNTHDDDIPTSPVLTTKDILFTDIDDILPSSAHLRQRPVQKNFPFLVSFKKFHVTKIYKTGYNKIYESRRSKSFFFEIADQHPNTNDIHLRIHTNDYLMSTNPISFNSTSTLPNAKFQISKGLQYFFSAQRVIPRRIQKKYFDLIRKKLLERITFIKSREGKNDDRNHTTKTFFNFSYKRYRFYFGIYVPCEHSLDSKSSSSTSSLCSCPIPSPIVMSNNRHGCGVHIKNIFQEITKKNLHQLNPDQAVRKKAFHANLIYDRWHDKKWKYVSSARTGVSYRTRYVASNLNGPAQNNSTAIYNKVMKSFSHNPSAKASTERKQHSRFERSCRRVLRSEIIKPGGVSNTSTKLVAAKKKKFLFLKSQNITHKIKHLTYHKDDYISKQRDRRYNTPLCHEPRNLPTRPQQQDSSICTVLNYCPIPTSFVPVKYRDIIPPDPIYDNKGSFIVPGSREWYTYMYHLELSTREERAKQARILENQKFERKCVIDNIAGEVRKAAHIRLKKEMNVGIHYGSYSGAHPKTTEKEASYYGTTAKTLELRKRTTHSLTDWNNEYHAHMTYFNMEKSYYNENIERNKSTLKAEMDMLLYKYPNISIASKDRRSNARLKHGFEDSKLIVYDPYTSSDTAGVEARPLKRDVNTNLNLNSHHHNPKRSRQDPSTASDSEQAGPSKNFLY